MKEKRYKNGRVTYTCKYCGKVYHEGRGQYRYTEAFLHEATCDYNIAMRPGKTCKYSGRIGRHGMIVCKISGRGCWGNRMYKCHIRVPLLSMIWKHIAERLKKI